jgi:hypothetical protein
VLAAALLAGCSTGTGLRSTTSSTDAPATTATTSPPTTTRPPPTSSTTTSTTTTTAPRPTTVTEPGSLQRFTTYPPAAVETPLAAPAPLSPFPGNAAQPGEGRWHPAGRAVDGRPAVYETTIQEPGTPGATAGIAWMDQRLLSATLYSGPVSPGGGPWRYSSPIEPAQAETLVAAFNGGFKMNASRGGYYDYGQTVVPLVEGAASLVIYTDGTATVGVWGQGASMGPDIAAVRQNLTLVVDNARPVPGLNPYDDYLWGATLHNQAQVWRSGVGVTADGALVYVAGPSLNIVQLAQILAHAGAVRAMELDINPAWPTFATYAPAPATASNGTDLLSDMAGAPYRFFEDFWPRDFITMSARPGRLP